jgi:L-ribulokinase
MNKKYVIGLDFGTDSARAVLIDTSNGDEISSSVKYYPRWVERKYCDPSKHQYRQHPKDYIEAMTYIIKDVLDQNSNNVRENVVAISVDTTGSTPVLVNEQGLPLAMMEKYSENPNAMFILWKDHTAIKEAEKINILNSSEEKDYLKYVGGIYSSEWILAKTAHVLQEDNSIIEDAYAFIEHCDWIPAVLTGVEKPEDVKRSRCASGHKALWAEEWGGFPPANFLNKIHPKLGEFRDHLNSMTYTSDVSVGNLTEEWSKRLGLNINVKVGVGAFDCHMGAVGGELKPLTLARTIGTSTCDIMIASNEDLGDRTIKGICGQVDGSVIPGYVGLEAGQSAFGDVYAWFKDVLSWPVKNLIENSSVINEETKTKLQEEILDQIIPKLSEEAAQIPLEKSSLLALDWMNGRRTPDASQEVKGAITGITLGSDAPKIFKALVESTAFGSKAIVDRFAEEGVEINEIIALGGVAKKSPFVMQTLANVLNMPIKVASTEQTCAFGAAMFAAVVGGVYNKVEDAQKAMGKGFDTTYHPDNNLISKYEKLYQEYQRLGEFVNSNIK